MKVDCIHALDEGQDCCIKCLLGMFGGYPSIAVCSVCPARTPITEGIIVSENLPVREQKTGQEKFDTCKHRSETEGTQTKKTCCKTIIIKGFLCQKLNIFPLSPNNCSGCQLYEPK